MSSSCKNCGCNKIDCGCKDSYLTTPPPCPTPEDCPEAQPCSEVFDAQCIVYTGEDINCGDTTVVSTDDTVAEALNNIVDYVCTDVVPSIFKYEIGEYVSTEGGVIVHRWLSETPFGTPKTGTRQNYLVVDTNDLSISAVYATLNVDIPNVESTWDGKTNTDNLILAGAPSGITVGTAAELCSSSTNNGKNDWYLPAIDELSKIFQNRWDIAQGLSASGGTQISFVAYWSSTELDTNNAWFFFFEGGIPGFNAKSSPSPFYVRALRKFNVIAGI